MLSIILPATDLKKVGELSEEIESLYNNIQIVISSNRQELGKGWAVREALKQCTGDTICFLDGDGDISPKMIKRLIPYLSDYDIVVGVKPISGIWSRRIITYLSRIYIALLFGVKCDTQTGIKLFRRYALHDWYNNNWLFDLEILADAKKRKLTMIEVPIEYTPGNKKVKLISLWKTFKESITLWLELK